MKHRFIFVLFILALFPKSYSYSQQVKVDTLYHSDTCFTEVLIDKYFKTGGVIIPAETKYWKGDWQYYYERFTPSIEEINMTEKFIRETLYMILAYADYYIPILEDKLNNYHRQYLGIYNESGDKIVVVVMHDFNPIKEDTVLFNNLLNEWRCEYRRDHFKTRYRNHELYKNDPIQIISREFLINITKRKLEKGGSKFLDTFWFLGEKLIIYSDCE